MANPEHVEMVKRGAEAIGEWRRSIPSVILAPLSTDLRGAHFILGASER